MLVIVTPSLDSPSIRVNNNARDYAPKAARRMLQTLSNDGD